MHWIFQMSSATHRRCRQLKGKNRLQRAKSTLIGSLAAASVQGAQSQGLVCYIKHFALNEEDANRTSVHTWASEQAILGNLYEAVAYAVKEGGAHGVMSALNCIGDKWCGECPELLAGLLRDEWGFQCCAVTDYAGFPYQRADSGVHAGNDLRLTPMNNFLYRNMLERSYISHSKETEAALRRASKNICCMVLQTNLYRETLVRACRTACPFFPAVLFFALPIVYAVRLQVRAGAEIVRGAVCKIYGAAAFRVKIRVEGLIGGIDRHQDPFVFRFSLEDELLVGLQYLAVFAVAERLTVMVCGRKCCNG